MQVRYEADGDQTVIVKDGQGREMIRYFDPKHAWVQEGH